RSQRWRWMWPRRERPRRDRAQDAARLVVLAARRHGREAARAGGAFEQQGVLVVGQHAGGTVAVPPRHQPAAAPLFLLARDLEHGGLAVAAHRQQQARRCEDRRAVGCELPSLEVAVGRQSPPSPPSTTTVSCSGSASRATSMLRRLGHRKTASSGCIRLWKRSTWARPQ